jgi:hypothetical protein
MATDFDSRQITISPKTEGMVVPYVFQPPLTDFPVLHRHVGLHEPGMIRAISSEGNLNAPCY